MRVIHTLLEAAIDYAGLFPPAGLPMDQATAEYAELLASEDAWMVHRFICPVAWLKDLGAHLPASVEEPWEIAVLGSSVEGFHTDTRLIREFDAEFGDRARVSACEIKAAPLGSTHGYKKVAGFELFEEVFVEVPWGEAMSEQMAELASLETVMFKARCGGLEPGAFPSSAQLAAFLHEAVSLEVPFKLTAGLHHPFPVQDAQIPARMHGFLNVISAVGAAVCLDAPRKVLEQILDTEDPLAFEFADAAQWGHRDALIPASEAESVREWFAGWGSCSVAEPKDDLASAGLLEG